MCHKTSLLWDMRASRRSAACRPLLCIIYSSHKSMYHLLSVSMEQAQNRTEAGRAVGYAREAVDDGQAKARLMRELTADMR